MHIFISDRALDKPSKENPALASLDFFFMLLPDQL